MEQQEAYESTIVDQLKKTYAMSNLLAGNIYDKRLLITSFESVVEAVEKASPDFAAVLGEAGGYTLLLDPVPYHVGGNQPLGGEGFGYMHPRPHLNQMAYGGMTGTTYFGIVPNGSDRVLIVPAAIAGQYGMNVQVPLLWDLVVRVMAGKAGQQVNQGFVAE